MNLNDFSIMLYANDFKCRIALGLAYMNLNDFSIMLYAVKEGKRGIQVNGLLPAPIDAIRLKASQTLKICLIAPTRTRSR
jgi:hypothetical protein